MRLKKKIRTHLNRAAFLFMVFLLIPWSLPSATYASGTKADLADFSTGVTVLSEWKFEDKGEYDIHLATGGQYQSSSILQNIGGRFEYYDKDEQDISYQGWDEGQDKKYWLATVSTATYENITLSSEQNSSGSGPNDFKIQVSTDRSTWTDVPNGTIQMNTSSSYKCTDDSCKLNKLPLPDADDKELLYIRWLVNSNRATNSKDNPDGIGGGGSSRIRNISVEGVPIPGKVPFQSTIDLMHLPRNGAKKVSSNAPFEVKFNKEISLVTDNAITVVDAQNQKVPGLHFNVKDNYLWIEHDALTYGSTYTVSIPKAAIQGVDLSPLVRDITWSFTAQDSPNMPKLINMAFNGDPKTSIALAWYTDIMTDTKVQVAEASQIQDGIFPKEATQYVGTANEISTYMTQNDRSSGDKTTFFSHKVIADHLKPGTQYKFRVGDGTQWSSIGSFMTDTSTSQPYRFIVGSDSQASSESEFEPWADTFKKANNYIGDPKFLISAGDLVDNGDLEEQWQWMLGLAQEPLLNVPYVPVLGGHEISDWDGDETTPNNNFYNHFNLPHKVVDATHDGSVYSFEYGDGLYMVFNSQFDGKVSEDGSKVDWDDDKKEQFWNQVTWMQNTVAKSDKKWKFVMFHKSPYAAGDNSAQWEDERVQFYKKNLIPVFDELGIDMVFEAHDHMYMRSFQMYGDKVIDPSDLKKDDDGNVINPKGTVYLMSNAFGNKFYYKNNQYQIGEDGEPEEILDDAGNPIPYDDYFAAIDEQPEKKMFTDVSLSDQVLQFDAMTAAVEDEGKSGYDENGLKVYDHYGIKRTDTKPDPVVEAKVELQGNKAILTWKTPSSSKEPVRGFRIYEKDDKVSKHWSVYQQVKENTKQYSLTIENLNPAIQYNLIIKSVGTRDNSDKVEVSTLEGPSVTEPPTTPTQLRGKAISPFQIDLTWTASSGNKPTGYHVYRNGALVGKTPQTSYSDIGLDPNTEYLYTVKAVNESGLESLATSEIRLKTKPSTTGTATIRPFPQHTSLATGSIKPNHQPQTQIDATVARLFDDWKKKYLKSNPHLKPSDPAQYYVWYADGDWFEKEHDDILDVDYDAITVSEAHGYGMLITAYLAGHDPEAKSYFDGLYRYFRAHPSSINPDLMAWRQGDTGQDIIDVQGVDSATDGDMDIAYALLLADSQWGSSGAINYLAEAKKVINAIMESDVNHSEWTLKLADWVDDSDPKYGTATRPSDFMLQHLRDFRNVTGDRNWDLVIDKTYSITQELYTNFSPNAGLLPDFVEKKDGKYVPAEPEFLESETDGDYSYNSSRTPWRIGTDYLVSGDARAKGQLNKLTDWVRKQTNDDPSKILAGYKLDGSEPLEEYSDNSFSAPMMVAAMLDPKNQDWLNRLWDHNAKLSTDEDVYFGNTLRLLSMMVVSGNWWSPTIVDTEAPMEPTIEKALAVSNTAIELKWTPSSDNKGVVGYNVYRDDALIATTDKTEFRDSGLMPNTKYRYFVVAYDAAGNLSKISNIRVVTTQDSTGGGSDTVNSSNGSSGSSGNSTNPVPVPLPDTNQPDKTPSFSDVDTRFDWAKTAIEYLAAKGIIKGTSNHRFEPGHNITRADFVLLLVRVFGFEGGAPSNFKDVSSESYYHDALSIAKKIGLAIGTGGDRFEPKAFISRQEMMVLLTRALQLDNLKIDSASDLSRFTDAAKLADYAKESAALLVKEGIIQGDRNTLRPEQTLTRAEAAVLIYRVILKYLS
ncbi:glycosyl hydrolase family 8 [Paenibacillus antarcticus]|uniref:Glucanase n=1 Tax=Paenibacillus antarcticus TaxID=253703 RepID=A0A168QBF4_9BACL|nr:glycosyl hydrolase family 8 [Paenibacillus antarcticus]OAB47597.1 licheninase [Paenibacillus antarcticus]